MKRKIMRVFSSILVAGLLLAGCSTKEPTNDTSTTAPEISTTASSSSSPFNPPGTFPILKEKVTLKFGIVQSPRVTDYSTNKFTKFVSEKVNVNLDFITFPAADATQKLAIMINANDKLPDIINMTLKDADVLQYGSQGAFIPLNDYYEKSSYYIKQYLDKGDEEKLPLWTSPDGNIYTVPWLYENITNDWSKKAVINRVWLDKLGLKVPTTTQEFYDVLKAFKTGDPNGNGKADEIPFMGSRNAWAQQAEVYLMNAFIYCNKDYNYITVENGKLDVAYDKPEWRAGLEYMNKLCSEGLLSPFSFTQDQSQVKTLIESGDQNPIGGRATNGLFDYPTTSKRKFDYTYLPPLTGPQGKQYAAKATPSLPAMKYYITRDCKNPEAAFKLADFMWSEEASLWARLGEPNVDWVPADPGSTPFDKNAKNKVKPVLVWATVQNSHWATENPMRITYDLYTEAYGDDPEKDPSEYVMYMLYEGTELYINKAPKEIVQRIIYADDEISQISDIENSLKTYVDESMVAFITGNKKPSDWDSYVKELDKIGLKKYLEVAQKAYDRMNKK